MVSTDAGDCPEVNTANPDAAIECLRERLNESDETSDDDADDLRRMSDRIRILGPAKYSDHRHEFLLMRYVKLAEVNLEMYN